MKELDFLRELKSATFCSVEDGIPKARIIDVMFIENDKVYFCTARGKSFYRQIISNPDVAVVAMSSEYKTIRIHGKVKQVDKSILDRIFELNPMLNNLYEGEKREILDPFCIYEGDGEILDLGSLPFSRYRFAFGKKDVIQQGYLINNNCISCGTCKEVCPEHCISDSDGFVINPSSCIECGRCYENCPAEAIDLPARF